MRSISSDKLQAYRLKKFSGLSFRTYRFCADTVGVSLPRCRFESVLKHEKKRKRNETDRHLHFKFFTKFHFSFPVYKTFL